MQVDTSGFSYGQNLNTENSFCSPANAGTAPRPNRAARASPRASPRRRHARVLLRDHAAATLRITVPTPLSSVGRPQDAYSTFDLISSFSELVIFCALVRPTCSLGTAPNVIANVFFGSSSNDSGLCFPLFCTNLT